jgi:hypothetical protein
LEEWHFGNHSKQANSGGEMDQSTLDTAMHHLNRLKSENRWYKWRGIITLLLVRSVTLMGEAAQASAMREEYEECFSGQPLPLLLQPAATISCQNDRADSTGYYPKEPSARFSSQQKTEFRLISTFEMQSRRAC